MTSPPIIWDQARSFLRSARIHRGLSQADLADKLGTTQSAISEWENGVVVPTVTSFIVWAGALGVRISLTHTLELGGVDDVGRRNEP